VTRRKPKPPPDFTEQNKQRRGQMEAAHVALPFWRFMSCGDGQTCATCAALDYFVARWNDPAWNHIYPSLHKGCRCMVVCIPESQAPAGAHAPGIPRLPAAARHLAI
jgi:uncharacterized protein with gpF-like domain